MHQNNPGSDAIDWDSAELRQLRKSMLPIESLSRLISRNDRAWIALLTLDLLIIIIAAIVSELYFSIPVYLLAIAVIGARQIGIASVALHEGAHRFLSRNTKLNEWIGTIILCALTVPLIGIDINGYRGGHHYRHHRYLLRDEDPEGELFRTIYEAQSPSGVRLRFAFAMLFRLSGAAYLYGLTRELVLGPWRRKAAILLLTGTLVFGVVQQVPVIELLLLYWIVPIATWGLFINRIRVIAEHYPVNAYGDGTAFSQKLRTRDVVPSLFDRLFVTTRNVNLHLSHHMFPAVPFYNLEKLHAEISASDDYQRIAHQTRGYHRFLYEYLFLRFRESRPLEIEPD